MGAICCFSNEKEKPVAKSGNGPPAILPRTFAVQKKHDKRTNLHGDFLSKDGEALDQNKLQKFAINGQFLKKNKRRKLRPENEENPRLPKRLSSAKAVIRKRNTQKKMKRINTTDVFTAYEYEPTLILPFSVKE
jgi:hypothetical protein